MSRSTNWMKKGFAWLLCLIMMTGMLSSAASADPGKPAPPPELPKPELGISYQAVYGNLPWIDEGETEQNPSLTFSAVYTQSNKPDKQAKGNFTFEWFFKGEHGDESVFKKADKENNVSITWDHNLKKYSASAAHAKSVKDLIEAKGPGEYYCKVTCKIGPASYTAETTPVTLTKTAKLVFLNGGDNGVDKEVYVEIGGTISEDQKPIAPVVEGSKFVGWKNTKTEVMLDFTKPVVKGGIYEAVYEKLPTFTVTFNYNHGKMGTFAGELNDDNSNTVKRPKDPEKCESGNHVFVDWYEDAQKTKLFPFETPITEDVEEVIIYAGWGYVVTFDVNLEGVTKIDSKKVLQDTPVTLPKENPTDPEGKYEFVCWKNGNKEYKGEKITKTTTLVAEWKKITQTISLQADESYVYNGKSQGVKVAGAEITTDKYTITYETKDAWGRWVPAWEVKNAGDYRATLSINKGETGYQIAEGGNQVTFTIQPKTITSITWSRTELVYDATKQKPSAKAEGLLGNDKCELTVSGGQTNAGQDYTATAAISAQNGNRNYVIDNEKTENVTTKFSIAKKPLTVTWGNTTLEYNDNDQAPTEKVEGFVESDLRAQLVSYSVSGQAKEIGEEHVASVVLAGARAENYVIPENATIKFNIVKIQPELSLSGYKSTVEYGEEFDFSYTLKKNSIYSVVSVEFSKEGVASAVINTTNKTIKITGTSVCNEPITVTVKVMETAHHKEVTASFKLEVTKRFIELDWKGKEFTYDGEEHCPTATVKTVLVNGDKVEDLGLTISGGQTNAGENYTANANISSDKYELAEESKNYTFKINKATVTIDAENVNLTYGDKNFDFVYSVTGVDKNKVKVTVYNPWGKEVVRLKNGKLYTVNAGEAQIELSYAGDSNHKAAKKTIKVTVAKKELTITWQNTSFKYDWQYHCPTVNVEGLVEGKEYSCTVNVTGANWTVGKHTARVVLSNDNYEVKHNKECDFYINKVANRLEVIVGWGADTEHLITDKEAAPKLKTNNITYRVYYNDNSWDHAKSISDPEVSVSAIDYTKLGKQTITVSKTIDGETVKDTFEITLRKEIKIVWDADGLVYNGEAQGPKASVNGFDDKELEGIISITFNGVNANTKDNPYKATATLTKDGAKCYKLAKGCDTCEYVIDPKPVTLTWSFDGAAFEPIDGIGSYDYFVGSDKIAPTVEVGGVIEDDDCQLALITSDSLTSDPLADTTSVGVYYVRASLFNSNYVFDDSTTTSVSYRIINKLDNANIKVEIPQCGQESPYSRGEIGARIAALNGVKMIIADYAYAQFATNEDGVQIADREPVAEALALSIDWASLTENANSALEVQGILVPRIEATDVDSFLDAISSLEDDTVKVYGENTYSLILFITSTDSLSAFDADAIKTNLSVADEKGQKTIRYAYATRYGVVALVDVKAVHNYDPKAATTIQPQEDEPGKFIEVCKLNGKENHTKVTEIPALTVTKIEVLDGYTTGYYVNDAYDNTGLKIKVTLSDTSSFDEDVTVDMVSGFDSSTDGTKTLTITRKDKTVTFDITVSKKKSSIDLKNVGDKVTVTYGDAPIDLVFDAFNGDVNISSSDKNVAKVENGKLVIVGAGEAEITLEIKDTNAVEGFKKSFKFVVDQKTVGLEWSKDNTFTEDGAKHSLTAKATGLVGTDSCDVIVEGGSDAVGTHTVTATGLSNKNYKLPEKASTTFVIKAKEEPKKEEPKKEEPKAEEPKKEDPKAEDPKKEETKIKADVKISNQFKDTYVVGEKFDPTGLTLEIENADGTKTVIPVTNEMVSGFDSSKVGNGEAIITYEDFSKKIPVTIVEKGEYTFTITTEANGDMHFVVIRKPGNEIAYSLYLGTYVDGKLVPADGIKTWPGSVHGLLFADYLKTLPAGDHKIEVVFKDGKAVATLTIPATTPASDASPVTGDTGNQMMWIILLAAAAVVLVVIRVYAAKRSNAE